jgi:hypothetical protein
MCTAVIAFREGDMVIVMTLGLESTKAHSHSRVINGFSPIESAVKLVLLSALSLLQMVFEGV